MVMHLCVCLYGFEKDLNKGYIDKHDTQFIVGYTNRANLCDTRGVSGVGGYPSSQVLAVLKIKTTLVQNTYIFIVTKITVYLII